VNAGDIVRARIHQLIAERGWSQRMFADHAHRTQAWASRILQPGHLKCLLVLDEIARAFNIESRDLLDASAVTRPDAPTRRARTARTVHSRPHATMIVSTLRLERLRRGLSLRALGRAVGVQPSDLSKIERGLLRPYPDQAKRLAGALHLRIAELLEPAPEPRRSGRGR
jgi:transcriptional regulator with XRE-family HTH domain